MGCLVREINSTGIKAAGYADDSTILGRAVFEKPSRLRIDGAEKINQYLARELIFTGRYAMKTLQRMVVRNTEIRYVEETKYLGEVTQVWTSRGRMPK